MRISSQRASQQDAAPTWRDLDVSKIVDREEALRLMFDLDGIIADLDKDLSQARAVLNRTGRYSDPRWFSQTITDLRLAKRLRNLAQERRGAIAREEVQSRKRESAERMERAFISAAKRILAQETFGKILDAAHADVALTDSTSEKERK